MHVDEYKTLVNTLSLAMEVAPPKRLLFHKADSVDAYITLDTDGGSTLGVTIGALKLPRGQVRALVAHELAHSKNDDLYRRMALREDLIFLTIMATGLMVYLHWQAFLVPLQLAQLYYYWRCRRLEYHADDTAAQYVGSRNVIRLLMTLEKQVTKSKRILNLFAWWAESHPTNSSRIKALVKKDYIL